MKVATAEQMKQIDHLTQELFGVPGIILMERAALGIFDAIVNYFGAVRGKNIYICCGKGNNGGDGLALARLCQENEAKVTVILATETNLLQGLAKHNFDMAEKFGVRLIEWSHFDSAEFRQADLIVDALLGTGASGSPSGTLAEIIIAINQLNKPIVAVDIPSGLQVDNGQANKPTVKATFTVTFGLPKPGLLCYPGPDFTGQLIIKQVGFPKQLLESEELTIEYPTLSDIKELLPYRQATSHKGSNGHVLVIGGSPGMTGAVALSCLGALRTGAGLVTAGIRMELPFPEKPLEVMIASWPDLLHRWDNFDSIVFGPGLSKMEDGETLLYHTLEKTKKPIVIDADGLNILAGNKKFAKRFNQPIILTPHPGEMARLTGLTITEIQTNRIEIARRCAGEWQVYLVLKGAHTVIATPDGRIFINPTGNQGMATAGMGDVLAGIIGGLIAQGVDVLTAGVAGTFIHGLAGDLAAEQRGVQGLIASDLIAEIPFALKKVQNH